MMPKPLEMKMKREAMKKGLTGARADAFTHGTMHNTGRKMMKKKKMNGIVGKKDAYKYA